MSKAIRFYETGGADVLKYEDDDIGKPAGGEVLLRHTAIGLNFIDTYHRTGLYPLQLPSGLGLEAAGVIEEVGPDVHDLKVGDRVAYGTGPIGAYSDQRIMNQKTLVRIPDAISDEAAAASMLKGMTVEYLLHRTYPVKKGETILFHAAAGGVGLLACQWAKALGCTVVGTVGSEEKGTLAKAHGCDHLIYYREEDIAEKVKEITRGEGVSVVYDSVGADTFSASIACLKKRGMLVSFGQSSGPVPDIDLKVFAPKSLFYTRPSLFNYCADRNDLEISSSQLFGMTQSGKLKVEIGATYSLSESADAHRDLEARKLQGSTILKP